MRSCWTLVLSQDTAMTAGSRLDFQTVQTQLPSHMNTTPRLMAAILGLCQLLPVAGAHAESTCTALPSSVQNISVSYISKADELNKLDETLGNYLQPCMEPVTPSNSKAICSNGRVVAEQVLRVISRVDDAGKHNAFLANAKMKSYKTGSALLDRIKGYAADRTCR